ncbi:MAG TPA: hypothetical protein VIL09_07385 [Microvirga sp.]|jgi:hypothetical protein
MDAPQLTALLAAAADEARRRLGCLSLEAMLAYHEAGVAIVDPFSTLIAPGVAIGAGTILYPGVSLRQDAGGRIAIGPDCEIGADGGFTVRASGGVVITVGAGARLSGGGSLSETSAIGDGAQILGAIDARACRLEGGGCHRDPDPDARGGVLKGAGRARGLHIPRGRVIQAFGLFDMKDMLPQSHFHPHLGKG